MVIVEQVFHLVVTVSRHESNLGRHSTWLQMASAILIFFT